MISEKIKSTVRDVQDFPKPGILFKDITPLLVDFRVRRQIVKALAVEARKLKVEAIIGIESRGFLFGISLADELNVPFVPVRKAGKLPFNKNKVEYELEYGTAEIEIHTDALVKGSRVLIHDDLLATGGTAVAAAELVKSIGGDVAGFGFIIELSDLKGREKLLKYNTNIISLAAY